MANSRLTQTIHHLEILFGHAAKGWMRLVDYRDDDGSPVHDIVTASVVPALTMLPKLTSLTLNGLCNNYPAAQTLRWHPRLAVGNTGAQITTLRLHSCTLRTTQILQLIDALKQTLRHIDLEQVKLLNESWLDIITRLQGLRLESCDIFKPQKCSGSTAPTTNYRKMVAPFLSLDWDDRGFGDCNIDKGFRSAGRSQHYAIRPSSASMYGEEAVKAGLEVLVQLPHFQAWCQQSMQYSWEDDVLMQLGAT